MRGSCVKGTGQRHMHTHCYTRSGAAAPYVINGNRDKVRDREGAEREREKKRHHRRGSVRVQKQTGIEEEGSISRPLFSILFLFFFLSFTRQSPHCDWMSRRLPWRQLGATMPAAAAAAEVPGQAATRQRRH